MEPAFEAREAPVFEDTAPLSVKAVSAGISLESSGATAGRVLVEIAEAARVPMHVEGFGASVRLYAHVAGMPAEALIDAVAQAAGLVTYREEGKDPTILDPEEAARRHHAWVLSHIEVAPIETRLVPSKHPVEVGAVLAQVLLPCKGEIVAAPERSILLVRGRADSLNQMETLALALEAQPAKPFQIDLPAPVTMAAPKIDRSGCEAIAAKAAPDLPRGKLTSEGSAAGALLREIARKRGQDVVVGCGGERPVFFRAEGELDPERIASALGLARLADGVYGSSAMRDRRRLQEMETERKEPQYQVRGFVVPGAAEVALAVEQVLAPGGHAVPYAPGSMVVVGAPMPLMQLAEELMRAWRQDFAPRTRAP